MDIIFNLIVLCVVFGIAYWIIQQIPGFPGNWIVNVVFGLIAMLLILGLITGGIPTIRFPR
jgi:hypothetical protein